MLTWLMSETPLDIRPTDLATAAGVTVPYASQLLNGHRSPSLKLAIVIERELGVPATAWPMPKQPQPPRVKQGENA